MRNTFRIVRQNLDSPAHQHVAITAAHQEAGLEVDMAQLLVAAAAAAAVDVKSTSLTFVLPHPYLKTTGLALAC